MLDKNNYDLLKYMGLHMALNEDEITKINDDVIDYFNIGYMAFGELKYCYFAGLIPDDYISTSLKEIFEKERQFGQK